MPLNHDIATVSIAATGLCLGCYNPDTQQWEVGFIRHPEHALTIKIVAHTPNGDQVLLPETAVPDNGRISIEPHNDIPPASPFFTPEEEHPEDFSQIFDIETKIYNGQKVNFKRPVHPVTPMFVSRPLLYAVEGMLIEFPVNLVRTDVQGMPTIATFERVSTTVGADIVCDEGGDVVVKVECEGGFERQLAQAANTRYSILLNNDCPTIAFVRDADANRAVSQDETEVVKKLTVRGVGLVRKHSDFALFYTVIDAGAKGTFDLEEAAPPNLRGPNAICNYAHLSVTRSMFPLP